MLVLQGDIEQPHRGQKVRQMRLQMQALIICIRLDWRRVDYKIGKKLLNINSLWNCESFVHKGLFLVEILTGLA